ncbi:DNA-binding transcriptional regulator, GntR family [Pseudoxanthobacter soli DSM 19599]|uniref:DNA-binding transcriptional regulator, GntR family n=2 Tax=Pseudoxanthobacter TaxID=433838 RepID=A0A1M7ZNX6_9HYPH|nr:DNA-binding transcriptional regulator, GntR family [Pseudoxanthobacter soli DSM 19599]
MCLKPPGASSGMCLKIALPAELAHALREPDRNVAARVDMSSEDNGVRLRGKHPTEDLIYERLVDAIIDKHLRAGEHLNEVKLAEAYDVPRSRVRRVLERLRDEDVVVFQLNRGAFVSRPTIEDAHHVYEARRELECIVVRLACQRATAADIERLRQHLRHEREMFDRQDPSVNRVAAHFHHLIAEIARNPVFEKMLAVLIRRGVLIQSVYEQKTGILCLTHEHERVVDFIEANRPDDAAHEMTHHFEHIVSSLNLSEARRQEADIYEFLRG